MRTGDRKEEEGTRRRTRGQEGGSKRGQGGGGGDRKEGEGQEDRKWEGEQWGEEYSHDYTFKPTPKPSIHFGGKTCDIHVHTEHIVYTTHLFLWRWNRSGNTGLSCLAQSCGRVGTSRHHCHTHLYRENIHHVYVQSRL